MITKRYPKAGLIFLTLILWICLSGCEKNNEIIKNTELLQEASETAANNENNTEPIGNDTFLEDKDLPSNAEDCDMTMTNENLSFGESLEESFVMNQKETIVDTMDLDEASSSFIYGTWVVEELLGFANSYNDASEYPNGQDIIGNEIIIEENKFSSLGIKNYSNYQHIYLDPYYYISAICYNSDNFYRLFKIDVLNLHINDEVKYIHVSKSRHDLPSMSFFLVNNNRLVLMLEATCFELSRSDKDILY